MQSFALNALDLSLQQGAAYADARVVHRRTEELVVKNRRVDRLTTTKDAGFGVRVLVDGA